MGKMSGVRQLGRIWLAGLFLLAALETAAAQPRRVLLLHSFGPYFAPWNMMASQFRDELIRRSPDPIDFYEVSLQFGRSGQPQEERPFIEYLNALFTGRKLDLMVAVGAPAARFILAHRSKVFPATPFLISGADERTFSGDTLGTNDTAVPANIDAAAQIEAILQLLPGTTNVAIVIGDSPLERFWVAELRRAFARFAGRVTFHWLNELPFDDMLRRVAALPPHSAVYYATVRVDANGIPHEENQALTRLRAVTSAPIFSYVDSNLGHGIVGGPLVSTLDIARQSAAVAVRVFGGESPGSIKVPTIGLSKPVYDWRELQHWGIGEAALPPDGTVQFRKPPIWQAYRLELAALVAAILAQAALIGGLLIEHRRRQRAEVLARNTMSELMHMNRVATAGELSASLAHEVNQPLTGISARASAALRWLAAEKPEIEKTRAALTHIVNASHRASEIVTSVRAMFRKESNERLPVDINSIILTVLQILRIELRKNGIEVQLLLDETLPRVECDRVQIQQVVLNLAVNAIEAMQTTEHRVLRIRTSLVKPFLASVSIEDTGAGIDPASRDRIFRALYTTKASGMGMGLSICHSIIESHNGRIWASAAPSNGSVFQFELPTTVVAH
jgi:signal transduction histidine kinase